MRIYEAIKELESYKKKVIIEYRMEQAKADFDNVKLPSRRTFYSVKFRSYYERKIKDEIDKLELAKATYYFTNNIPFNATNEYGYLNSNEIKMLETICAISLTGLVII